MSAYESGTVAMVTALNRSTPWRAFFDGKTWRECGSDGFCVDSPTSIRPLVVLDLSAAPFASDDVIPSDFAEWLRFLGTRDVAIKREREVFAKWLADQIEAQSQPARIPEPGVWGVVEAAWNSGGYRWQWVRHGRAWLNAEGERADWNDLIDPTLVRPGIEDAS